MRAMKDRARRHLPRAMQALALAIVATLAATYLPLAAVERGRGAQVATVVRGVHSWWNARDAVFGVRWSNLQLIDPPLASPTRLGELPSWAEPPEPPFPEAAILRVGTLAAGWPFPTLRARWTVTTRARNFPMPAEVDDQDTSIRYATESLLTGARGGGPEEKSILWAGVVGNLILFGTAAWLALAAVARLRARVAATRPEGAEAAPSR